MIPSPVPFRSSARTRQPSLQTQIRYGFESVQADDLVEPGAEPLRRRLVFATVFQLPWQPQPASFAGLSIGLL
jgi:hypothetical protein